MEDGKNGILCLYVQIAGLRLFETVLFIFLCFRINVSALLRLVVLPSPWPGAVDCSFWVMYMVLKG